MQRLIDIMAGWSVLSVALRLILAAIVGVVVGLDRELKNRGAGIKTHVLVCAGSALAMIVSEYVLHQFPGASADLNRMGAGVISGVSFLGVGTIVITGKNEVRGLTTAAGLWACACTGLAAGIGFFWGTVIALLLFIFVFRVLNAFDVWLRKYAKMFDLYLEFDSNKGVRQFFDEMRAMHVSMNNIAMAKSNIDRDGPVMTVSVEIKSWKLSGQLLDALSENAHIRYYEGI
jgi:putative Mg2+ transporter-C (MgtC) family protein